MLKIKDNVDLKELEKYGFNLYDERTNLYDKQLAENEEINIYGYGFCDFYMKNNYSDIEIKDKSKIKVRKI